MLNKIKRLKQDFKFKKIGLLLGVFLLVFVLGNGINMASAGQDINSLLTNWFSIKKDESIKELDTAITTEKDLLMENVRTALKEEMGNAQIELTNFTDDEIEKRISALRNYTDDLINNMHVDNSDQMNAVVANLEGIYERAIAQMNGVDIPAPAPPASTPGNVPEQKPGTTLDPDQDPIPEPEETVVEPEPVPTPIPEQETEPDQTPEIDLKPEPMPAEDLTPVPIVD